MPSQEIDNFTELAEGPALADLLVIVDSSDITDSPQGTTKKNKVQYGLGSQVNPQTSTSYTYLTTDFRKLVTHTNASPIAGTLPQAGASFPAGWWMLVQNRGAGALTVTPTTSTIDGAASLVLNQNEGALIVSDGTNYFTFRGKATGGSGGIGDVVGPTSATDNALTRFDGSTGKLIQNSTITLDDVGALTIPEMTAPGTPAANKVSLYAKSDGLLYSKDDAGTETLVSGGAGGGGGIGGSTGATDNAILRADGTGGSTAQPSAVQIDDTTGKITQPSGAGDKIVFGSSNFGLGTESDINAVTVWSQDSFRVRRGGTTVGAGTEILRVTGGTTSPATVSDGILSVNALGVGLIKSMSSSGDKFWWQGGSNNYGTGIEADNCVTQWSQDRHRWRIGGTSVTTGTETMVLTSAGLYLPTNNLFTTAQFDKTDTTLSDVTGLSYAGLIAGKTYKFEALLPISADATGGSKFAIAMGSSGTATAIWYEIVLVDNTSNLNTITSLQTSVAGSAGQAGTTSGLCIIRGTIVVNNAGSGGVLKVQFAQNAATGTSSILRGATFTVIPLSSQ